MVEIKKVNKIEYPRFTIDSERREGQKKKDQKERHDDLEKFARDLHDSIEALKEERTAVLELSDEVLILQHEYEMSKKTLPKSREDKIPEEKTKSLVIKAYQASIDQSNRIKH